MVNKNIHSFNVEYDEESDTVKSYLEHLENSLSHEEMRALVHSAEYNPSGEVHLEDHYGNKVTLVYKGEGSCLIRKRQS